MAHTNVPKYKLIYFPLRGRGEYIRYLFALGEVQYEDEIVSDEQWPEKKPRKKEKLQSNIYK